MGVVCDDTEACVWGVFFHYAAEGHLGGRGHGVGFVEDDEFEICKGWFGSGAVAAWCGGGGRGGGEGVEDLFGGAEGL